MTLIARTRIILTTIGLFLTINSSTFSENLSRINAATVSRKEAKEYSQKFLLHKILPNFDENYDLLQRKCQEAVKLNIPRIDMPVIEPQDIAKFQEDIKAGKVDVLAPFITKEQIEKAVKDMPAEEQKRLEKLFEDHFPKTLDAKSGKVWLTLGTLDADSNDDKIEAKIEYVAAKELIPTQSQIWLDKLLDPMVQYGIPKVGSSVLETTIIISQEGYILDGHHRFGQVILANPELKMKVLRVPLNIELLLKLGRSYGNAIGNKQKA